MGQYCIFIFLSPQVASPLRCSITDMAAYTLGYFRYTLSPSTSTSSGTLVPMLMLRSVNRLSNYLAKSATPYSMSVLVYQSLKRGCCFSWRCSSFSLLLDLDLSLYFLWWQSEFLMAIIWYKGDNPWGVYLILDKECVIYIMIYTYSPNWYKPQCLHFSKDYLYYCSNYVLYEYSLAHKQIEREKCFREIALDYNFNHKDIKISAIESNQHTVMVGINQPYLVILDRGSLDVIRVVAIEGFQTIEYLYPYRQGHLEMIVLCNKDGNLLKYSSNQQKLAFYKIDLKHRFSPIKAIHPIHTHHFAVFTRGTILIYNSDFSALQKVIEASFNDTIYSVDCFREQEKVYFAFLTKNKDSHTIIMFEFKFKEDFPLEHKKRIGEIAQGIKKFDVFINYPKKLSEKLKQNQKASLTIKLLSKESLILTGKLGEIITLHTQSIKSQQLVHIKPYSYQQEQVKQYEIWSDSRHYKEIYSIYNHQSRLYIISTDHNLTVWDINQKHPKYVYAIKFLTSSVQSFFYSESDPRNVFALLKDSAIRSFTPFDQGSHQLNEYWKFSKKFRIKKAVCHPNEQGILGLVTECNSVQLYDVYQDRLMKLMEIGEQILNVSFQFPSIEEQLQLLSKGPLKEQKYKTISQFTKEMDNKTVLLIQTKDSYIIVSEVGEKEVKFMRCQRLKKIERIHENRYWDGQLLLTSHTKNNVLTASMLYQSKNIIFQANLRYQQGRALFKKPKGSQELVLVNFKGTKFTVFRSLIDPCKLVCEVLSTSEVTVLNPIDYLFINYSDWRIAIYGQRDDTIIVIHLDRIIEQKYQINKTSELAQLYWINTKIDSLILYLQDYIITATKDQTIKVVKYHQLSELKKQNKKNGFVTKVGGNLLIENDV